MFKIELKNNNHAQNFYKTVKKDENHTIDLFCNLLKYDLAKDDENELIENILKDLSVHEKNF